MQTSEMVQGDTSETSNTGVSKFKKVRKSNLLKKRRAEEDIVSLLENVNKENGDQTTNGLGTREQKQKQLE